MTREDVKRVFSSGWLNFKRNSWLAGGTIGIMVLALLIFSGLVVFNVVSQTAVSSLEEKVDVTAYLGSETSESQASEILREIESLPEVDYVTYVSRERALEEFSRRHEGEELVQQALEELGENPLQASIEIKAVDTARYASLVSFIENSSFINLIDKIDFYENELVINRIQSISSGLRAGGIAVTLILALIAVMVTFNTIRLTIYSQRQEIEIMRLVGASNWHIRGPYLVEGAVYGIIAGLIVLFLFYPTVLIFSDKIQTYIPAVNLTSYFTRFFGQMILLVVGSGVGLGIISSSIAIRRYLKI